MVGMGELLTVIRLDALIIIVIIVINPGQHCCGGGIITEYVFTELNFTERVRFPLDQDRQEAPAAENSLCRVGNQHGAIRTLRSSICLECRGKWKFTLMSQRRCSCFC